MDAIIAENGAVQDRHNEYGYLRGKMTGAKNQFVARTLASTICNNITLLDAVEIARENGMRTVVLFFDVGTSFKEIGFPSSTQLISTQVVNNAPLMVVETKNLGDIQVIFNGISVDISPATSELGLLEGGNVALSERNGETADTVLTWLKYHCSRHGMTAAVILDRAEPESDPTFAVALKNGVEKAEFSCSVILINANVPTGRKDLPAESHPYCVQESPGRERLKPPEPDPWFSPIGVPLFYEIARMRFLNKARAVANFDVYDLLVDTAETSIFDRAVNSKTGLLPLYGKHCYPWRLRKKDPVLFADHICTQFDGNITKQRWCIAPAVASNDAVWRMVRILNAQPDETQFGSFYRCMLLRHPAASVSKIVAKTSLLEDPDLVALSQEVFDHKPARMPKLDTKTVVAGRGRCAIVTTMKNEGPFILEWLAHHRTIGVDDFLIYTNDCSDGTDTMLDLLQSKGYLQHRKNPFRETSGKPQQAALRAAEKEPVIVAAKWVMCIDVDEFVNIHVGSGSLDDLFTAVPDANIISMTWRLFGNADIHEYADDFVTKQFTLCARELAPSPYQAWGFKTLFQNIGLFKKLGIHRPKGLNPQLLSEINWVNGSGKPMPTNMFRRGWRSSVETYGYDLVTLNHYSTRSAESFLVKRDRGRVNHVDRDQGLPYWFRMNNNTMEDTSIQRQLPALQSEYDKLMADPEIAAAHASSVQMHRDKISELRKTEHLGAFFDELTSAKFEKLSKLHAHFGTSVFLAGPESVPAEIIARDPTEEFSVSVKSGIRSNIDLSALKRSEDT